MKHYWIDYLKTLAIIAVIILHVTAAFYPNYNDLNITEWWNVNILNSLSRFCVPLFIMISGALLLGKNIETISFYKKRSLRLLPATIFWSLFFFAFTIITKPEVLNNGFISYLIYIALKGNTAVHLWYLTMFICLMLFTPFLNHFVTGKKPNKQDALILFGLSCIFMSLQQLSILGNAIEQTTFTWFKSFAWFIPYFLMGYFIKQHHADIKLSIKFLSLLIISLTVIAILENHYLVSNLAINKDYISLPNEGISNFLITTSLFTIMAKLQNVITKNKIIEKIAAYSFGIYLVHPFYLYFTHKTLNHVTENNITHTYLAIIATFIFSYASIALMKKIKPLKYIC